LLLLISAGLFARSLLNLSRVNLGFRTDRLLTFALSPKLNGYDNERASALYDQVHDRLSSLAGVASASSSNVPALADSTSGENITIEGFASADGGPVDVNTASVGPDYFRTLKVPLVTGREFSHSNNRTGPKVVIVNRAFIRKFFDGTSP